MSKKTSESPESGRVSQGRTHYRRTLDKLSTPQRCRSRSSPLSTNVSGESKSKEPRTALLPTPRRITREHYGTRRRSCSEAGARTRSSTKARGDTRKEGCSRITSTTVRSNSHQRMEKWKSRLQRGDVVLEDPRFRRQRTESDSLLQSPSHEVPYNESSTMQVTPKAVNKRTSSVESISKRIKAELVEQSERENNKIPITQPLPAATIKKERRSDAGTSARNHRKWVLQKFIDGIKTGDPINLSELEYPVPIGRDPMKVKIHLDGPKKKHVSRYHAELHDDGDGLRVQCFSDNGILVNHTELVTRNASYILRNSDIFSIGDASDAQKDSVQNIMFVVHCETTQTAEIPHVKPEVHPQIIEVASDSEEADQKALIGSSTACPILIIDDDEEAQAFEGSSSVRVENNDGLSDMLMKFKDEPVDDEEVAAESPSTASSTGSPVIPANGELVPLRTPIDKTPRIEQPGKSKNPALAPMVSPRGPMDSPTETRPILFGSPPPPRIRETADFAPTFNAYRHCILNLDVNRPDGDPKQISEKIFIDFVQEKGTSKSLRDVTRVLFSVFCLEAASRVKAGWRKSQQSHTRKAAIMAQAAVTKDVYRVTLMLVSEGRGYFTDCTALKISANFVRLDSQGTKKRVLLAMMHKVDTIDCRRRSGGIQVPALLVGDARPDHVDILEIDVDKNAFKGAKLDTETLIDVSRVCEVRELKKILCLRQIPDIYCKVLRGMKGFTVMGPHDLPNPQVYPEQVARVTHCSMLTSEQTSVVCAALSLVTTPVTTVSTMLVEGEAGTGKSVVLLETAFECVYAKPDETVLIFCKWSGAADLMAHSLLEIKERKKLKLPNGKPLSICRVAGSQHQRIHKVCLTTILEERRNLTLKQEIERKDKSIHEQKKRIADLKISLEDQLEKLPNFVKTRKLSEISQQEVALASVMKERVILAERLKQPTGRSNAAPGATAILENTNILICSSADIETNIIGQAFRPSGQAKISVVLIDQAQQCLLSDLLPIMQLNCQRLVMFGDSNQSTFLKHVVKHKVLKEKNPYVPSEFVKCCRKYYNKRFCLTRSFRVRPPLREIVSNIFIRHPAAASVQTFNGSLPEHDLSPLTIFDIDEEPREELIVERIVQACAKVLPKVHLVLPSSGATQKFQALSKKLLNEQRIALKVGIPEVLDADNISILIIPTFDANLLREINVDRAALYSMLTRAAKATVVVGNFSNIREHCPVLDELAEQSKAVGRFFHHSARTFMHIDIAQVLMHLRP